MTADRADKIMLNIGSGQRPFARPWINVDTQDRWRGPTEERGLTFVQYDVTLQPLPWEDGAVDVICLHHVLEHLELSTQAPLLAACHRLLKPGGRLLVFVPDLKALAKRWLTGQLDNYNYFVQLYGAYMGDEHDFHHWGFDMTELVGRIRDGGGGHVGWSMIGSYNWNEKLEGADIARDWYILGVEATK